ncbi:Fic family protein [Lysobacter sp. Hz 25]|uniref:Fic family protein n=1 Tax=Lysobacter sp. Hz 25 TaxID=3383698 RepID=UPI0038D3B6A8
MPEGAGMQRPVDAGSKKQDVGATSSASVPMGRFDSVPSAITGVPLTYFTPAPLNELLRRFGTAPIARNYSFGSRDSNHCLILVRLASLSSGQVVDIEQARRLAGLWLQPAAWTSVEQLIEFARSISPGIKGLREEISFVGGPTASRAKHIFAPASELPNLVEEIAGSLGSENISVDAAAIAALVGFCAVHAHPFVDGNGRWSRALAMYAGMRKEGRAAMSATVFLSAENQLLCERIWPDARRAGADTYMAALYAFERTLFVHLDATPKLVGLLDEVNDVVRAAARGSRRLSERLMVQLYAEGGLALAELRARCGLSTRAATGCAERLRETGLLGVRAGAAWIDMAEPLALAADAVSAAGAAARKEIYKGSRNEA